MRFPHQFEGHMPTTLTKMQIAVIVFALTSMMGLFGGMKYGEAVAEAVAERAEKTCQH